MIFSSFGVLPYPRISDGTRRGLELDNKFWERMRNGFSNPSSSISRNERLHRDHRSPPSVSLGSYPSRMLPDPCLGGLPHRPSCGRSRRNLRTRSTRCRPTSRYRRERLDQTPHPSLVEIECERGAHQKQRPWRSNLAIPFSGHLVINQSLSTSCPLASILPDAVQLPAKRDSRACS